MNDFRHLLTDYARAKAAWDDPAFVAAVEAAQKQTTDDMLKAVGQVEAGYQTPLVGADGSGTSTTHAYSPLVPQALDPLVGQLDFRASHLAFFDWLPKQDVKNTVYDWGVVVSNGDPWLDGAMPEGALGGNDVGSTKKGSTKIKSYTKRHEITDIAANVTLMNTSQPMVSTSQMEMLTKQGMLAMHRNLEVDALHAKASAQIYKMDGVISQLKAANQVDNLDGATISMEYLEEKIRDLTSAPYYARPTHIFVPPKIYTDLSHQQNPMLRRNPDGKPVLYGFGAGGLKVEVGDTVCVVQELKFLDEKNAMIAPASSAKAGPSKTTIPTPALTVAAAGVDAASKFAAGDVGTYKYAVAVFAPDGSYSMSNYTGAAVTGTSAAGSSNLLTITANAAFDGGYAVLFRCAKGVTGTQKNFEVIGRVAMIDAATSDTTFTDQNLVRNNSCKVLILRQDPEEVVLYQLIKLLRTPLAKTAMSQPFALFTACGLQVKVPEHQWLLENVGYTPAV